MADVRHEIAPHRLDPAALGEVLDEQRHHAVEQSDGPHPYFERLRTPAERGQSHFALQDRQGPEAILQREMTLPSFGWRSQPLEVRVRAVALLNGMVALLVEDFTESRRVEAVRRDFVANVGHEIKTPVGALALLAEAALDARDDPDAVHRFLQRMQHEAARLSRLVQELLDLSRLQGGDPLPGAGWVRLDAVVDEAVDRAHL